MKIGELAAATGLAPSAIRFYEQSGLLPPAQRAPNGYRTYAPEAVEQLRTIQLAQSLGFTLDALRAGLLQRESRPRAQTHADLLERLDVRLGEIDRLLATLRAQRRDLLAVREQLQATWATGACLDPAAVRLTPAALAAPAAPARAAPPARARRASRR